MLHQQLLNALGGNRGKLQVPPARSGKCNLLPTLVNCVRTLGNKRVAVTVARFRPEGVQKRPLRGDVNWAKGEGALHRLEPGQRGPLARRGAGGLHAAPSPSHCIERLHPLRVPRPLPLLGAQAVIQGAISGRHGEREKVAEICRGRHRQSRADIDGGLLRDVQTAEAEGSLRPYTQS